MLCFWGDWFSVCAIRSMCNEMSSVALAGSSTVATEHSWQTTDYTDQLSNADLPRSSYLGACASVRRADS